MKRFLTIEDGIEDGMSLMVLIESGMEKETLETIEMLEDSEQEVKISYDKMSDEEYRENEIKGLIYIECCTREEAVEILDQKNK